VEGPRPGRQLAANLSIIEPEVLLSGRFIIGKCRPMTADWTAPNKKGASATSAMDGRRSA
jgi:hypothetical protein